MTTDRERPFALVTGGATGIGAAVARRLAGMGFDLGLNYTRSRAEAEATAAACAEAGAETLLLPGDVSDDSACRGMVAQALDRFRRLDTLVNNAGTTRFVPRGDLEALQTDDFERIFAVNLRGAFQMTRAAAPALRRSPYASVVNVSSHSGISGMGSSLAYAASKGALNTLTIGLARELAPEIRVNAVCPGFVTTRWTRRDMDDEAYAAFKARAAAIAPLKRTVGPEDVADAVAWFVTGARAVTGQLLVMDAGVHLTINTPV